jgi:hypothetical protein
MDCVLAIKEQARADTLAALQRDQRDRDRRERQRLKKARRKERQRLAAQPDAPT